MPALPRPSLGRRSILLSLGLFAALVLASPATYLFIIRAAEAELDRNLLRLAQECAVELLRSAAIADGITADGRRLCRSSLSHRPRHVLLQDGHGRIVASDCELRSLVPEALDRARTTREPVFSDVEFPAEQLRIVAWPFPGPDGLLHVLEVGASRAVVERSHRNGLLSMTAIGLLACGLLVGGSLLLRWRLVSPIVLLVRRIEGLNESNLVERLPLEARSDEVARLVLAINRLLDRVERSCEAQRRFTSDVSHEIRSPLTALRGEMEVALRKERAPEEYQQVLRRALEEILRLARLADNLLQLARADAGALTLQQTPVELGELLAQVLRRMKPRADEQDLRLVLHVRDAVLVIGDPDWLARIVENLLDNAIRYSPRLAEIDVRLAREGDRAVIAVQDPGCGIPSSELPRLFERFHRVDPSRSREEGGTGLGLAIVRQIVTLHRGTIEVQSTPGQGSTFTVRLPVG